jgi:hypothetical protein
LAPKAVDIEIDLRQIEEACQEPVGGQPLHRFAAGFSRVLVLRIN